MTTATSALQRVKSAWNIDHLPADLVADLRSDHAGETGAVWIYRGILMVSRDAAVREFAQRHMRTEQEHLARMCDLLPPLRRSILLLPWCAAGWLTGALPALFGPRAVFGTIAAVETFVDQHYQAQIDLLQGRPDHRALLDTLLTCQEDECHHRDEATSLSPGAPHWLLRAWCAVVGTGSAVAVHLARRL